MVVRTVPYNLVLLLTFFGSKKKALKPRERERKRRERRKEEKSVHMVE